MRIGISLHRTMRIGDVVLVILCLVMAGWIILGNKKNTSPPADWEKVLGVSIVSRDRSGMTLKKELLSNDITYVLIMELSNCPSCIDKGILEIRELQKRGKKGIILVSHQWIEEWLSWVINYEQDPMYFTNKEDLESIVMFPYLPIILRIKEGRINSFKYISF
jgi:hypothetical protein